MGSTVAALMFSSELDDGLVGFVSRFGKQPRRMCNAL